MSKIKWDETGERLFETGVENGALFVQDNSGTYGKGVPWNGLTNVNESPEGGEVTTLYADDVAYLDLISVEKYKYTIEAYSSPVEFDACDGTASIAKGVTIGQQSRKKFGFTYKSRIGNDIEGSDFGYKLHIVYNSLASPSERSHATINDSPEAETMSWSASSTAVNVAGHKPTSTVVINSTAADPAKLAILENILYGKDHELTKTEPKNWSTDYKKYYTKSGDKFEALTGESAPTWEENKYYDEATEPRLPFPDEIMEIMGQE